MTIAQEVPSNVVELLRSGALAEFATISAAGVPVDTPMLYFPSEGLSSFDFTTGLSYPAKAERARRNPRVGLLIEGNPDEPVIAIAGMAAVRDSDLQANADRYISEAGYTLAGDPPWSLAQKAVWYWTRILIEVTPVRMFWWKNAASMDEAPFRWQSPADTVYPVSDEAPPGTPSSASDWAKRPWVGLADEALARGSGGHLTVVDPDGYPMPIRARSITRTEEGFRLLMPKGLVWPLMGRCSLSFQGLETFVGDAITSNDSTTVRVERALPTLPTVGDMKQLWEPTPDTYIKFMTRLNQETQRRGVPIPTIPMERPPPSEGYRLRMARGKPAGPRSKSVDKKV